MKKWLLFFSAFLNLVLIAVLIFLNERYGLLRKMQRLIFEEVRVPVVVAAHESNRNYAVRREIFRLDRNKSARVLMLGDSLTAQGEWNAMLGEPLVANRGIDGDTSAGVLARIGDDADFRGDAVVIWIGTNDVLQGRATAEVVGNVKKAVAALRDYWTTGRQGGEEILTAKVTNTYEKAEEVLTTDDADGHGWEKRRAAPGEPGLAQSSQNPSTSELARDSENTSLTRSASGPAGARIAPEDRRLKMEAGEANSPATSYPPLATAPEAQVFVLGISPMARWWEGAREHNAVIREINTKLSEGANKNGYRFIELDSVLADENGFLSGEMTSDGVHLSAKGYVVVLGKMKDGPLSGWRGEKNSI